MLIVNPIRHQSSSPPMIGLRARALPSASPAGQVRKGEKAAELSDVIGVGRARHAKSPTSSLK